MRLGVTLALAVLPAACGGEVAADGPAASEHDALFVGSWVVEDAVDSDEYAATLFALGADGSVVRVRSTPGGSANADSLATVARPSDGTTCAFGPSWTSTGPTRLIIDGVCSDSVPRSIVLGFRDEDSELVAISVVSVGGERGWTHGGVLSWSMRKCASTESCTLAWR